MNFVISNRQTSQSDTNPLILPRNHSTSSAQTALFLSLTHTRGARSLLFVRCFHVRLETRVLIRRDSSKRYGISKQMMRNVLIPLQTGTIQYMTMDLKSIITEWPVMYEKVQKLAYGLFLT